MRELFPEFDRWRAQGEEIALATLVLVRGSAPRRSGARMGLSRSGNMKGSVSGGCVENDVFQRGLEVLDSQKPVLARYNVDNESGFEIGLTCGGSIGVLIEPFLEDEPVRVLRAALENHEPSALCIGLGPEDLFGQKLVVLEDRVLGSLPPELHEELATTARERFQEAATFNISIPWGEGEAEFFIETFPPPLQLWIIGGTHTAIPLCRMAREVGFQVTIVDPRPVYASAERFPEADAIVQAWPDEALSEVKLDSYSYLVALSHDSKFDLPMLRKALPSPAHYIGALGSRATHKARKQQLASEGFSEEEIARIHAPIGLDLGGRSAEEIALSILAEMVAVRHEREGGLLLKRQASIYGDR